MGDTIKVRIHHPGGKTEKRGILIEGNARVPLNEDAIGISTPWVVEVRDTGVYLHTPEGERCIDVGYRGKFQDFELEFLELPVRDAQKKEDCTKVVRFNDIKNPVSKPQTRDDATSIILGMNLPEKKQSIQKIEVRSSVDVDERSEWAKNFFISFSTYGVFGEFAIRIFRHFSSQTPTIPTGIAFIVFGLVGIVIAWAVLKWKKTSNTLWENYFKFAKWSWTACVLAMSGWFFHTPEVQLETDRSVATVHDPGTPAPSPAAVVTTPVPVVTGTATPFAASPAPQKTDQDDSEPGNHYDPMAREAFFSAVKSGDYSLVKKMIEDRQVDVNFTLLKGASALHVAASRGDLPMVKLFLKHRANLNAIDAGGATPLMWAVFKRHDAMVQYLVKRGADLTIRRDGKDRAIDMAKRYGLKKYYAMLTPKEKSSKVAKKGSEKRTPASQHSKTKTAKTRK